MKNRKKEETTSRRQRGKREEFASFSEDVQRSPVKLRINAILGGFAGGGTSARSRKRHLKGVMNLQSQAPHVQHGSYTNTLAISFTNEEYGLTILGHEDPLVIRVHIANADGMGSCKRSSLRHPAIP